MLHGTHSTQEKLPTYSTAQTANSTFPAHPQRAPFAQRGSKGQHLCGRRWALPSHAMSEAEKAEKLGNQPTLCVIARSVDRLHYTVLCVLPRHIHQHCLPSCRACQARRLVYPRLPTPGPLLTTTRWSSCLRKLPPPVLPGIHPHPDIAYYLQHPRSEHSL
jgi:hypothetical protein